MATDRLPPTPRESRPELAPSMAFPWVIRLRFGLAVMATAIVIVALLLGEKVPIVLAAGVVGLTVISNVAVYRLRDWLTDFMQVVTAGLFCLDILCLTAILMLTGGASNPFSLLFLVQITLSVTILSKYWTWVLGLLSTICFGSLFWIYVPLPALEGRHHSRGTVDFHLLGMWVGFAVAAFLIAFFSGKISELIRAREQELQQLQQQLEKRERLASLATMAAGAAHELATPLGTIAIVAKELEHYSSHVTRDETVAEDCRLIRSETDRCRRILDGMSVQGAELPGEMPLRVTTRELVDRLLQDISPELGSRLEISNKAEGVVVEVPIGAVIQSLTALITNAIEAGTPGKVELRIGAGDAKIRFAVHDRGEGMTAEVLHRVSEPFFTTKPAGMGMGLGTFLVRVMAERLGGTLEFSSAPETGTVATLNLPFEPAEDRVGAR